MIRFTTNVLKNQYYYALIWNNRFENKTARYFSNMRIHFTNFSPSVKRGRKNKETVCTTMWVVTAIYLPTYILYTPSFSFYLHETSPPYCLDFFHSIVITNHSKCVRTMGKFFWWFKMSRCDRRRHLNYTTAW